ncbi:MAG: nucleotidyltransferase family protein [Geobacteraceae bacterium]|nr:nucleotidyltransferase family protein [Geobacteraceae bacterium]
MPDVSLPAILDKFTITPEFRLVVACSWIAPPAHERQQAGQIAALCGEVGDWQACIDLVHRHGVPGLAYTMLRRHAGELLPEHVSAQLKSDYIQTSGLALRQGTELLRIAHQFSEHSIELLVMKGILLSQRLYGDPAVRATGDIDLMVRLEDFDRAERLILEAGYRCISPGDKLTARQKRFHREIGQNCEYIHDTTGHYLEIHWRSYLWTEEQTALLWECCQSVDWMGGGFKVWDDDSLILFLSYHGAHHEWSMLKWLSDIAVLFSEDRPNGWGPLVALAGQLRMRRVLAQTVLLANWVYGISLPGELRTLIAEETSAVSLAEKALGSLLQSARERSTAGKRLDGLAHAWYLAKLGLPLAGITKSMLIKYSDFKVLTLPDRLFWLYVPLRPVFWLWRNFIITKTRI